MKYLLILLLFATACTKSKETILGIQLNMNATIVEQKYWAISLTSETAVTCSGTASVEWDVYNSNDVFMYHRSAIIDYNFINSRHTDDVKTSVQGAISMTAKNEKIVSVSNNNGYSFKY